MQCGSLISKTFLALSLQILICFLFLSPGPWAFLRGCSVIGSLYLLIPLRHQCYSSTLQLCVPHAAQVRPFAASPSTLPLVASSLHFSSTLTCAALNPSMEIILARPGGMYSPEHSGQVFTPKPGLHTQARTSHPGPPSLLLLIFSSAKL